MGCVSPAAGVRFRGRFVGQRGVDPVRARLLLPGPLSGEVCLPAGKSRRGRQGKRSGGVGSEKRAAGAPAGFSRPQSKGRKFFSSALRGKASPKRSFREAENAPAL